MIYLTFDTNAFIYSLDDAWKSTNELDYLESWINDGNIKLLLPTIICEEWNNNKEKETKERKKIFKNFFKMADEILPSAFFSDYKKEEVLNKIVENQLQRIENIIDNAKKIDVSSEIEKKIIEIGIKKKAPLHKKSSVADAVIVYSLIDFAERNQGNHFYFLSNDTSEFYEGNSVHKDLKPHFDKFNIKAFKIIKNLNNELRYFHGLSINTDFEKKRKERIKSKLKETIYNPIYNRITADKKSFFKSIYIQNINTVDFILKEQEPTKEQVIFILALIDSDEDYKKYFFKKVESTVWFTILKNKGFFYHSNNPAFIQTEKGFQVPYWHILTYLEKLSIQIKEGKEIELIDEIIGILKEVSENPKDNFRTWHVFLKILSNIPNKNISVDLLNFIPVWLKSNIDTMMQSSDLLNNILPKFLSNNPTKDDIDKANVILKHLLVIEKNEKASKNNTENIYRSNVYLYYLNHALIDEKLIDKIAIHCSEDIILLLASNLKKILYGFPNDTIVVYIESNKKKYKITTKINDRNLIVSLLDIANNDNLIETKHIKNFENYKENEIKEFVIKLLEENNIKYSSDNNNELYLRILISNLFNGYYFNKSNSITELNDKYSDNKKLEKVFALIFMGLLNETVKQNSKKGIELVELFALDNYYRLSFFRRIVLYIISENWNVLKSIFWKMIENNDNNMYFSNLIYEKELYELLKKNQDSFNNNEIKILKEIIDLGSQKKKDYKKSVDYWKLRWYSALKDNKSFVTDYKQLSKSQNKTNKHYEDDGKIMSMSASVSPFSTDKLLQKSNKEIVEYILNFKPKDCWSEPNIYGLSESLGSAVEKEPQKFYDEIDLYNNVYYIYVYRILNGFRKVWENKQSLNWENILKFIETYISSDKFYSGQLNIEYENASTDWVISSISDLLSAGMQSDNNAFDIELLPKVKTILNIIIPKLKSKNELEETNMDYLTYTLNSTAGKSIRALLDYSLRRGRNLKQNNSVEKWEKDIIDLLENTLSKNIIDGYTIIGWHFHQFYFLNVDWTIDKIKQFEKLDEKEWLAFIGGLTYSNPPFNKNTYELFYPHYEKAITDNVYFETILNGRVIIRHIVAFNFWGYESLEKKSLISKFLNTAEPSLIVELVNFICTQEKYLVNIDKEESKIENIVFKLWDYLSNKYEEPKNEEEQKILVSLLGLIVFVPQLDEKHTDLVLKSCQVLENHNNLSNIIKNLIKQKNKGLPIETAKYIGEILDIVSFKNYLDNDDDDNNIIELMIYLYENNQKAIADKFCNEFVKMGFEFLKQIYNKYNC